MVKQPFGYYGGKQSIAEAIVRMIPPHRVYVEPFAGGASVFWLKDPSYAEVLNDLNGHVVNFYRQLRDNAEALINAIELTPYSLEEHRLARDVYKGLKPVCGLERARLFFLNANASHGKNLCGGFGRSIRNPVKDFMSKKRRLPSCAERLKTTIICEYDANGIIEQFDSPETFFFIDPPYVGTDQGHYKGYTEDDLLRLVSVLEGLQGKFIISGYAASAVLYPSSWHIEIIETMCSAADFTRDKREEILAMNFVPTGQLNLEGI
jgi:DNA adenine methylase